MTPANRSCAVLLAVLVAAAVGAQSTGPRSDASPPVGEVPYVGTPHDVVARMLELAGVSAEDTVYDLGCGDGRILVAAARDHGARAVGFDLEPARVAESLASAARHGVADRVEVYRRDIFEVDLRPATVVAMYLFPDVQRRLVPQLEQLAPGSRVVAHNYGIEGWPADRIEVMVSRADGVEHTIYLWVLPRREAAERVP